MAHTATTSTISRFRVTASELSFMRRSLHSASADCGALAYPLEHGLLQQSDESRALLQELKSIARMWPKYMNADGLFTLASRIRDVMKQLEAFLSERPATEEHWKVTSRTFRVPCLWFTSVKGEVTSSLLGGLFRIETRVHTYVVRPSEGYAKSVSGLLNF